ncbi:ROK family protein [Gemella cuniculi]|uniref:ROK family protein n=1 Tax=Gemella cuniculi TaxID=150240 RepID=UPI00041C158F|nr:ROK family protein [Gemella cuniculi]
MYLGVDIGGTSIKFAVFDSNYKIVHYETCKTPDNVTTKITDEMYRVANKIRENYNFNTVGISAAGVIDNINMEVIRAAPTIKNYVGTNFKRDFGDRLGVDIYVDNDVNCALLGEQWLGGAKGLEEVFCLALGTGIGGAYYLKNLPFGSNFGVGEIGQSVYDADTDTTYEQRASTIILAKKIKDEMYDGLSVIEFFDLCRREDSTALKILDEWLYEVARGIVNLLCILDPKYIIIGGAISAQGDYLLNKLEEKVRKLHPIKNNKTKFLTASLGNDAALYGAISPFIKK